MNRTDRCIVRIRDVVKEFDGETVVNHMNLDIAEGEFLTILGPSGCGKTTTLRMIAGFEEVTQGEILLEGASVEGLPPNVRNVNTVFQNYALFPHMSVEDNIAFGLVEKKVPKDKIKEKVSEAVKLVQLEGLEKRKPSQLSGGQRQRVGIARAIVNEPKVLLLDEPLGALDLKLRKQMQEELKHLQRQLGITFLYVTHDQEEALTMSDRIVIMNHGRIEQVGTPEEVYNFPRTKFVADFIGESNLMEGYVEEADGNRKIFVFESGKASLKDADFNLEEMFYICIRPENLRLSKEPREGFSVRAIVREHIFVGAINKTVVELINGQQLVASTQPDVDLFPVGTWVYIFWDPGKASLLHTKEEQIYNAIEEESMKMMEEFEEEPSAEAAEQTEKGDAHEEA